MKHFDIVAPEFVLNKVGFFRTSHAHKLESIERSVEGEIAHHIGPGIVFTHLITRGREEGEQYFLFRMLTAKPFHERTTLFKLA